MIRRLVLIATLGATAVALVWALSAPAAVPKNLAGSVGPGTTISLKFGGKAVKTLKPGLYRITVRDRSGSHNFVLSGPGLRGAKAVTSVADVRSRSLTVQLKRGRYTFYCRPHSDFMKGGFTVR